MTKGSRKLVPETLGSILEGMNYTFAAQSAGEIISKIGEHLAKLQAK